MSAKPYPTLCPVGPSMPTPRPIPFEFAIADFRGSDGNTGVVIQWATPLGLQFYFLSQEAAMVLADEIRSRCTGIVLARPQS